MGHVLRRLDHSPSPDTVAFEALLDQKSLAVIGIVDGFPVEQPVDHALDALASFDGAILAFALAISFVDSAVVVNQLVVGAQHGGDRSHIFRGPESGDFGGCQGCCNICRADAVDGNVVGGQQRAAGAGQCEDAVFGGIVQGSQGEGVQAGARRRNDHFGVEGGVWTVGPGAGLEVTVGLACVVYKES